MDFERLLVENLPLVESVIRLISRRHRLSVEETEELAGTIKLKLVDKDYQVLRQFQGRSQLRTYLITVVERHFLDERNAQWGKWRPSAAARRLGPMATLLDQLITRDRLSFGDAAARVRSRYGNAVTDDELRAIERELPARVHRQFLGEEHLDRVPAQGPGEAEVLESIEHSRSGARVERALATVLSRLRDDDRIILRMRFTDNVKLARIAQLMGVPPKLFYRRVEELLSALRQELRAQGISESDVARLLKHSPTGLRELLGIPEGITSDGPSAP